MRAGIRYKYKQSKRRFIICSICWLYNDALQFLFYCVGLTRMYMLQQAQHDNHYMHCQSEPVEDKLISF